MCRKRRARLMGKDINPPQSLVHRYARPSMPGIYLFLGSQDPPHSRDPLNIWINVLSTNHNHSIFLELETIPKFTSTQKWETATEKGKPKEPSSARLRTHYTPTVIISTVWCRCAQTHPPEATCRWKQSQQKVEAGVRILWFKKEKHLKRMEKRIITASRLQ